MLLRKGFKFRLEPMKRQLEAFPRFAGCSRFVFNRGLRARIDGWEKEKKSLSYFDQNNILAKWKNEESTLFLKEVHSQILQQSLRDLDLAFKNFFRRIKLGEKPGFPRFKCRGERDSFRFPQGVRVKESEVYLPRIGWVKFRKSREIQGIIKQTTIIREGDHWYVCFSCECEVQNPIPAPIDENKAVGIDLGLISYATLAQSKDNIQKSIANPRPFKQLHKKITKASRALARKQKGSKNRLKCKRKLNRLHAKARNYRHNFIHQLSRSIVKNHDIICVESLKVNQMLISGTKARSRSISDASWRQFLSVLRYKTEEMGKHFVEIGTYFPSSQICSSCSSRKKLTLSEREYCCENCGLKIDRDWNAAINIKAAGMSVLNACGATKGMAPKQESYAFRRG